MIRNLFSFACCFLCQVMIVFAVPNGDFESGFLGWFPNFSDSANNAFLDSTMPYEGLQSACINVQVTTPQWWDSQLINQNSGIQPNETYVVSFYAKCDSGNKQINISLLDNVNFTSFSSEFIELSNSWSLYSYEFTSSAQAQNVGLYVSAGIEHGIFCFDDFKIAPQCEFLVFEDNFNGGQINADFWTHEIGPGFNASEPQYFTDSPSNTTVANGILNLIAREENVNGYNYSSSAIITEDKQFWKYGRFEARMKVPAGQGIWPAFWLLPQHGYYGGWPNSGEVDIMEFQGSLPSTNFASVHFGISGQAHNSNTFQYQFPNGNLSDDFHVYALDWVKDTLTWSIDGTTYNQIVASQFIAPEYYPFNEPFYMLLNLSLGGWNGQPDNTTPFPSTFEIDYVKVYQYQDDISIHGNQYLKPFDQHVEYSVPEIAGATYQWILPTGFQLESGQGTSSIFVNTHGTDGTIQVNIITSCGSTTASLDVNVEYNWCTNGDFEQRLEHWYPIVSDANNFSYVETTDVYEGNYSACMEIVNASSPIWWEDQLDLFNTNIIGDAEYEISFFAKCDSGNKTVNASLLDNVSYTNYYFQDFILNDQWTEYNFTFNAPVGASNIGLYMSCGFTNGTFCFDNIKIQSPGLSSSIYMDDNCITIFPNPDSDYVTISGILSDYNIKVLDINGSEVQSIDTSDSRHTIRINSLGTGLYFLWIENKTDQLISIQQIIKI